MAEETTSVEVKQGSEAAAEQTADTQTADTAAQATDQQTDEEGLSVTGEGGQQTEETTEETTEEEHAPEQYEGFTAPEGTGELDAPVIEAFQEVAKVCDLSQSQAQAVIDKVAPVLQKRSQEQFVKLVKDTQDAWLAASRADKEFAGAKLDENVGKANAVLRTFGTPDLRKLLVQTGLGKHPEIIRFCYRLSQVLSEDQYVQGGKPSGEVADTGVFKYTNSDMK